jgi:cytochrome b561
MTGRPFPAVLLHWTIAALLAALLGIGWWMTRLPPGSEMQFVLYQLHKSLGVTVLLLSLLRLARRILVPSPPLPHGMPRWARVAARCVQGALLALTLAIPLTGWALVSASRLAIPTVLFGVLPWPDLPGIAALDPSTRRGLEATLAQAHAALAWAMAGLALLHAAAAIFHHAMRGDLVLRRMLPAIAVVLMFAAAAAPVRAQDWRVDPARSRLGFEGIETGNAFRGRFARWTAEIAFDPADLAAARVRVVVDIASASSDERRRDEAMLGEDWLDARVFPRAVFEASGFRARAGGGFETTGTLVLRDRRQPVTLIFSLEESQGAMRALGEATLIRTQFGVGRGRWSGPHFVGVEVKVLFDLTARRAD